MRKVRRAIRKQKSKVTKDATLLRGIKQGVGMVVKRPFRSRTVRTKKATFRGRPNSKKAALCALTNLHLPLPRAVGAYTVTKTTTVISSSDKVMLFGCLKGGRTNHPDPTWFNAVAVSPGTGANTAIKAADNAQFHIDTALTSSGFNHCRLVPAAITVQVMCPKNLQSADGITYIGRSKEVLDLMGDTRTWTALADQLVSYSAPRLCSAGRRRTALG